MTSHWDAATAAEGHRLLANFRAAASEDRWRLLVLLGRANAVADPDEQLQAFFAEAVAVIPQIAQGLSIPHAAGLLDDLASGLDGDPHGELFDALLAIDDVAGVHALLWQRSEADALVDEAVALLSTDVDALVPLSRLAIGREPHLCDNAPSRRLWHFVAYSPARSTATAMSGTGDADAVMVQRVLRRTLRKATVRVHAGAVQLAAAAEKHRVPIHASGDGWEINEEPDGRVVLQVRLQDGEHPGAMAIVRIGAGGRDTARWRVRLITAEEEAAYYDLGTRSELLARIGSGGAPFEVDIDFKDQGHA